MAKVKSIRRRGGNNNPTGRGGAKKGEVRNPHGRPKLGCAISELLRQEGDELVKFKYTDINGKEIEEIMTKDQVLIKQAYALAMSGNYSVLFSLLERKEPLKKIIEMMNTIKYQVIPPPPERPKEDA